ncbi:MAG TPA: hypothetical protein VG100_05960 [Xanthobacteraceae bacterium]|nr:hypothetical protein [Xanthobacteraceae bacterium]
MASSEARPETSQSVRLMAAAFDQVLERLPDTVDRTDEIRRDVALFIVDHFRLGEHDPDRLSDLALAELVANDGESDGVTLAPDAGGMGEAVAG